MTTPTQTGDKPMVTQRAIELLERAHAKGWLGYEAHGAIEYAINVLRHRAQETLSPEQSSDTIQRLGQEFDGEQPRLGREALEALVQHNERLRSAVAIADRDGADTNWKAFRGQCRYTLAEYQDIVNEARAALARAALSTTPDLAEENERLRPMEDAPKDGRYIIAAYRSLDGYAEQLHGRSFIIRHEGTTPSGYDLGWALFPGHGGVPDKCFSGWLPLPTTLQSISTANGGPGRDGVS